MSWNKQEIKILQENLGKKTFAEIAGMIGKTERAVKLYVLRKRIPVNKVCGRNLLLELLKIKFVNPEYFHPNKSFYRAVMMTPQRWWDIYLGRAKISEKEYQKLVLHFQVSLEDAFNARQLKLFDE